MASKKKTDDTAADQGAPDAATEPTEATEARTIPLAIVGMGVQFFTNHQGRQHGANAQGPYAAVVTEVLDAQKGFVNLTVFPPFHPSFGAANVGNLNGIDLGEDQDAEGWRTATFA